MPIRFRKNVPTAWVEITLAEGLNRQVRRMTAAVGHPTLRLVRVAIGPVVLGGLQPGEWRDLTSSEIEQIYSMLLADKSGGIRVCSEAIERVDSTASQIIVQRYVGGLMIR